MELASCHLYSSYNFDVTQRRFENFCVPRPKYKRTAGIRDFFKLRRGPGNRKYWELLHYTESSSTQINIQHTVRLKLRATYEGVLLSPWPDLLLDVVGRNR